MIFNQNNANNYNTKKKILLYYDEKDLFEYYTNNFKMALNIYKYNSMISL